MQRVDSPKSTGRIICHRCGCSVKPIGEEHQLVRNGITTCRDCLLFVEKNALSSSMKYDAIQKFKGSECVPHAKWKAVRRPVGRPRIQPIIAVFVYHKATMSLLHHLQRN
ncbi:hypothetical protein WA171_002523 [Blastocystis sp. BT1]